MEISEFGKSNISNNKFRRAVRSLHNAMLQDGVEPFVQMRMLQTYVAYALCANEDWVGTCEGDKELSEFIERNDDIINDTLMGIIAPQ